MPSRARTTLAVMLIAAVALTLIVVFSGRPPEGRPSSYLIRDESRAELVAVHPVAVVSARESRDRRMFEAWVRAVVERAHRQRAEFLRAALELHERPFLVCVRAHESDTAGGYRATDGGRGGIENLGAYQFDQSTWNSAARNAGAPHLVGVRPTEVSGFDQDRVAWAWYLHVGPSPWAGSGCY